jgi:hypothetical protein
VCRGDERVAIASADHQPVTTLRENAGDDASQAATAAGDEGDWI